MSLSRKCDRCKKFYNLYPYKDGGNSSDREGINGISLISMSDEKKFYNVEVLDLCPECLHSLKVWLDVYLEKSEESYIKTELNIETEGKCDDVKEVEDWDPRMIY